MADSFRSLSPDEKRKRIEQLTQKEADALFYDWSFWRRPDQETPPGQWSTWLVKAGRGYGKTRVGAEWVRGRVLSGKAGRFAFIAKDPGEARDVMIEGESGLLAIHHRSQRPTYEPSKKRVTWPNGALGFVYSSEDPEELRGPQHDAGWVDEFAKQKNQQDVWDNYQFGLRLGVNPQTVITTTPRPTPVVRQIINDPNTIVTNGSTFDNKSNLPAVFFEKVVARYDGTRLGRQEIYAELLLDTPGALWTLLGIEQSRDLKARLEDMDRVVVAIDPSASSGEGAAEAGIVVCASRVINGQRHGYVFGDCSTQGTPNEWAGVAIRAYNEFSADRVIAETNNGGEMVEAVLRNVDSTVSYSAVHASRGKQTRAEPISALYERGLIHHVGIFPELEDQMTTWIPGEKSPDRMDALVWGLTELFGSSIVDLSMAAFGVELVAHRGYLE